MYFIGIRPVLSFLCLASMFTEQEINEMVDRILINIKMGKRNALTIGVTIFLVLHDRQFGLRHAAILASIGVHVDHEEVYLAIPLEVEQIETFFANLHMHGLDAGIRVSTHLRLDLELVPS